MEKQIDICSTCAKDELGFVSIIGTIPQCVIKKIPAVPVQEVVRWRFGLQGKFCGINRHECSVCKRSEFRMSNFCPN